MAQVFISFIHEESGYADAVKVFLRGMLGSNITPFLSSDKLQVYAGEKWIDRIMEELKEAKVVILMLSTKSVSRPWVNFEAGAAWTRNIVTIPVCYGGLSKDDLPKPYASLQAVDLTAFGDDEYLATSVAHHLGLREPIARFKIDVVRALPGLEGPEYEKQCEQAGKIYKIFQKTIEDLKRETC